MSLPEVPVLSNIQELLPGLGLLVEIISCPLVVSWFYHENKLKLLGGLVNHLQRIKVKIQVRYGSAIKSLIRFKLIKLALKKLTSYLP